MEIKSKQYFSDDTFSEQDSKYVKYFEFAKEAVNEKKSRDYRGEIIHELINTCIKV
jgi:hypothetical protein